MPMIEIDQNARDVLITWKSIFGTSIGANIDYSEAIRKADACVQKLVLNKTYGKEGCVSSRQPSALSKSPASKGSVKGKSGKRSSKPSRGHSRKST